MGREMKISPAMIICLISEKLIKEIYFNLFIVSKTFLIFFHGEIDLKNIGKHGHSV